MKRELREPMLGAVELLHKWHCVRYDTRVPRQVLDWCDNHQGAGRYFVCHHELYIQDYLDLAQMLMELGELTDGRVMLPC